MRSPLRSLRVATPADPHDLVRVGEEATSDLPFPHLWDGVVRLYRTGLHPAIGLTIRHRGEVVLDRTIGHLDNAPGGVVGPVATPDALFNLFSASKILTAFVVHALIEDGLIDLEAPAAKYLPAFARHGKGGIRVRHLLQHTAGIADMPTDIDPAACLRTGKVPRESLYDLRPKSAPGAVVGYHPITSWLVLEAIVEEVTGEGLREVARRRLLDPLGFRHFSYGVAPHEVGLVARHASTGLPTARPMARIFERTVGLDLAKAVELTNDPAFLTGVLPSANVIATGRETTRFLQMLLNGGQLDGVRVLREETVRRAVTDRATAQSDATFGFPMRYGLGVMMGGDRFSLFGLTTRDAFGHLGFTNVVVYADPKRDLAVSFLNTGKPMLAPGMLHWYWALQKIALLVPKVR